MLLADIVILLAAAAAGLLVGRALGLPSIATYLVVGVILGPGGFGWISHSATIEQLAEIGVALLLFGVGIEFSLHQVGWRLWQMIISGVLQVGLTVAGAATIFFLLGTSVSTSVFLGFLLALSSTAIVFKLYSDEGEIDAPQGQAAAGILLFQDLALVPMMLLVPALASPGGATVGAAVRVLVGAVAAVGGLLFVTRAVLPRLLELVSRAGIRELFPIAALVIAFGTALGATGLGLSLPIGTFLAGLALSGSRYGHQVFAEVLPLRDAFVAIFFTSIGMLFEPAVALLRPDLIVGMLGMVGLKAVLVGAVVFVVWRSAQLAIMAAFALAQVGEFSFVLSRAGAAVGLLSHSQEQVFLCTAILTMAATPFLMRIGRRLTAVGSGKPGDREAATLRNHVLVIGHGTTGEAISRVLRETGIQFCAVDLAADVVATAREEGIPIHFGDASRRAVLDGMGATMARAAVVTVSDPATTRRAVTLLRQLNADILILVRVRRVTEIPELESLGADEVIPSEFETSIELFVRLLMRFGVPRHVVRIQESLIRMDRYRALRGQASSEILPETRRLLAGGVLETAQVMERSEACAQTLSQLDLRRRTGATILTIVRNEVPLTDISGDTRLEAEDSVVLYGPHEAIAAAQHLLEPRDLERTD